MSIDSDITFRKLEIFITFMTKGNLSRTASALGISSVSVHRALHSLEESLRCPLFIHQGRNLVPMPAAHTLWEYSQEALDVLSRGIEEARKSAGMSQGSLRLGTLYSLTLETIPQLIMGMKLRRPDLELELTMGSNQMLLDRLEEGTLDAILIAISSEHINHDRLEMLPLFDDDIFLAAPAASGLNIDQDADLRDFRHEKFVSLDEGFATWNGFREAFAIAGYEPEIVTRVNDIFSMLSLVQAGVGFTLLPGRMKRVYEHSVQLLKLAEPYRMQQNIAIVFERNREHDPNLLALVAEGRMYSRQRGAKP